MTISVDRIMCAAYRSGAKTIPDIAGRKEKRYKITCPENLWKILRLSPLLSTINRLLPLRYKIS